MVENTYPELGVQNCAPLVDTVLDGHCPHDKESVAPAVVENVLAPHATQAPDEA